MSSTDDSPRSGSAYHPPNVSSPLSNPPLFRISEKNEGSNREKYRDDVVEEHDQELDGEDTLGVGDGDRLTDQLRTRLPTHSV